MIAAGVAFILAVCVSFGVTTAYMAPAMGHHDVPPFVWALRSPFASLGWLRTADIAWGDSHRYHHPWPQQSIDMLRGFNLLLGKWLFGALFFALAILAVGRVMHDRWRAKAPGPGRVSKSRAPAIEPEQPKEALRLHIGTATGKFNKAGHSRGIKRGSPVVLGVRDLCMNILIYGGVGAGKTVYAINRFLRQILFSDSGILTFAIKDDAADEFKSIAATANRDVVIIGPEEEGGRPFNLFQGLTPATAATFLKSVFVLAGNTGGNTAFFVDQAVELSRNVLGILWYFPRYYSLFGLYQFIFKKEFREMLEPEIGKALDYMHVEQPEEAEKLETYLDYYWNIFSQMEAKETKSGIEAELLTVLSPFTEPQLRRAFCEDHHMNVNLEDLFLGDAILMRLPLAKYGIGGQVAYTLVKLRFFNMMQRRRSEPTWNQDRTIAFVCDEYQQIVTAAKGVTSDLTFWDKSRSAGCVGIISAQGYSSFLAAIGNEAITDATLQNFRQKIVFSTEDEPTIKSLVYTFGKIEVERESQSESKSRSSGIASKSNASKTTNKNTQMRQMIDPQTIRQLGKGEAICLTTINEERYDDILQLDPLYITVLRDQRELTQAETYALLTTARKVEAEREAAAASRSIGQTAVRFSRNGHRQERETKSLHD